MQIKVKIEEWVKKTLGEESFQLVHPKDLKNGDFAFFSHSPKMKNDLVQKLEANKIPEVEKVEVAGPFVNVYLSKEFFGDSVSKIIEEGENFGKTDLFEGEKVFIEHTQQNPFKEFHIGHLMPNTIGDSVARIIKANGAEMRIASYHGDVGLHVAKAIWGKMEKPELSWGDAYAHGAEGFEKNKEEIVEINKKVYNRTDEKINSLYDQGRKESLENFEKIYEKLDSHFDFHFFESETGELGKRIVKENIGKIFEESEGAVVFRGENFEPKTHTRVFLNKEDLPTYEAKEIGLAKIKKEKWPDYTKSITVTANEQDSFFKVVEVAIGEVFPELKGKLKHLSHGMLKLPDGKMSSRTGNIITAENLIDQVKERVLDKIKDREFSDKEKNQISEIIAIGAIKYSILRQAAGGDIVFDFEKSISFEGDSGPYLQYTYVRAKSVLGKAQDLTSFESETLRVEDPNSSPRFMRGEKEERPGDFEIQEVEKMLYRFSEIVKRAGKEYAPHYLVTYLVELASGFNSFYAREKIIDEANREASAYKLALTQAVAQILKNGLHLLGIKVPERM
ncbi:MAG: arginine--tRNA ligase [Patescibacteria group bacterium]